LPNVENSNLRIDSTNIRLSNISLEYQNDIYHAEYDVVTQEIVSNKIEVVLNPSSNKEDDWVVLTY